MFSDQKTAPETEVPLVIPRPRRLRRYTHQKRAGLGVWAATSLYRDRRAVRAWKASFPLDDAITATLAASLADLVNALMPVRPPGSIVTTPPQGASSPGPYAAEALARGAARILGLPYHPLLTRTEAKRWHGPRFALAQEPFTCAMPPAGTSVVLILDDLATTGRTLRLSLAAVRAAGFCAFGFAYSGV